jgi:hypothetical protein
MHGVVNMADRDCDVIFEVSGRVSAKKCSISAARQKCVRLLGSRIVTRL